MPKPKKQTLTVAELKSLLLARFNAEQRGRAKLQARIQQELGRKIQEETPEITALNNKFADWISDVLARRLKRNRRATPLLSSRDLVRLVPLMIDEIAKAEGYKPEAEERRMLAKLMRATFEGILEAAHTMVSPRKDPYEESWRWVTTVLDLASERGVLPAELLALEGATDEIMRRMFTKRQFIALSKRMTKKFANADVLRKMIIQPALDTVAADANEEERRELERELEGTIMPQLRAEIEKTRAIADAFRSEEVERIYGKKKSHAL